MQQLSIGGRYRHYKRHGEYEVIGVALDHETLEEMVVYKPLYDTAEFPKGTLWVRPKKMFLETVEYEGMIMSRFQLIDQV